MKLARNKTNYSILIFLIFFSACTRTSHTTTTTLVDNVKDKVQAEMVATEFYDALRAKDYEKSYKYFSPRFFQAVDKENLKKSYISVAQQSGAIKNYNLMQWHTQTVAGDRIAGVYKLKYNVERAEQNTTEVLTLYLEGTAIKIVNYNVTYSSNK